MKQDIDNNAVTTTVNGSKPSNTNNINECNTCCVSKNNDDTTNILTDHNSIDFTKNINTSRSINNSNSTDNNNGKNCNINNISYNNSGNNNISNNSSHNNSGNNNNSNNNNLLVPRRHNSVGSRNNNTTNNLTDCSVNIENLKQCIHPPETPSASSNSSQSSISTGHGSGKDEDEGSGKDGAPPDGGWGWVVLLSSFVISLLVDGVCFTQGIFFPEFRKEFDTDASTTSWVGSVLNGTYMCVGPLVSVMCHVYGCRRVAAVGAVFAAAAFSLSTLCPNIGLFVMTYGFLAGCGFGMMYLPAIVMVGYYFSKRRALATGIACCGSGIGGFAFAPLGNWLIEAVGWRGATYVLAAMVASGFVFALFYRPLEDSTSSRRKSNLTKEESQSFLDDSTDDCKKMGDDEFNLKSSDLYLPKEYHGFPSCDHIEIVRLAKSQGFDSDDVTSSVESMTPLRRKDIFYSGNIARIPEYNQVARREDGPKKSSKKRGRWAGALAAMFDVTLLKSPTFIVYGTSCFLCMMGFFVPFTYMPSLAMNVGVPPSDAAFLISIIGITNIVGRVAVGYVSDLPWADCLLINNCALCVGGVATALVPHMGEYWMFAVYSAVFGLAIAVFVSLRSIIMVELMGIDRLTMAFGFVILCQGASSLIGSPIAGAISDLSGAFTYSFYMAGASLFLSGLICFPLRRIARWEGLTSTSTSDDVTSSL